MVTHITDLAFGVRKNSLDSPIVDDCGKTNVFCLHAPACSDILYRSVSAETGTVSALTDSVSSVRGPVSSVTGKESAAGTS